MTWRPLSALPILAVGMAMGYWLGRSEISSAIAQSPQSPPAQPQESRLLANMYMITAAEYRACCLQTYRLAEERLKEKLCCRTNATRAPAVLMDLDETVFDNSGFQTVLYRDRLVYRDELWEPWERDFAHEVRLIPGARQFIEKAEAACVTVIYMSNRNVRTRESTVNALKHNGINVDNIHNRLELKSDSSDKTARRSRTAERFDVLLTVGDNLRDFSEEFKVGPNTTIASRFKAVDEHAARWGNDWFILPNCCYGEWEKLLGQNPAQHFPPTAMPNPEKK
jgi:5'-nucleotidase (lipoprotein e(P4) family)